MACHNRETQKPPLQALTPQQIQQQLQTLADNRKEQDDKIKEQDDKIKEQDDKINTLIEDNKKLQLRIAELDGVKELDEDDVAMANVTSDDDL